MVVAGWQQHWYPIAFVRDLRDGPHRFAIHGRGYVLFRTGDGALQCLEDRCPHRAARLSDGVLRDGRLECLYHGWQFAAGGRCVHIPQLARDRPIPARANVATLTVAERQGIAWAWAGEAGPADPACIPTVTDLDRPDAESVDFAIDLPYEQTFLVENVIDVAHIHIAHDGIRGGGLRELAAPIRFEITERSAAGLRASFRSIGAASSGGGPLRGAQVAFRAPNLVHYESLYADPRRIAGLALYSLPQGAHRCRLLYRAYSNFRPLRDRLRPRWLEHWTQCRILEQDMDVVVGQADQVHRSGRAPRELWLPIDTSDSLVLAYRRWLDEHAADWPYAVGFARAPRPPADGGDRPRAFDRYAMHTAMCASCSRAERIARGIRGPLLVAMVALLAGAAVLASTAAAVLGALAVLTAVALVLADRVAARFR